MSSAGERLETALVIAYYGRSVTSPGAAFRQAGRHNRKPTWPACKYKTKTAAAHQ